MPIFSPFPPRRGVPQSILVDRVLQKPLYLGLRGLQGFQREGVALQLYRRWSQLGVSLQAALHKIAELGRVSR